MKWERVEKLEENFKTKMQKINEKKGLKKNCKQAKKNSLKNEKIKKGNKKQKKCKFVKLKGDQKN
jgi:hypothetical protein